MGSVNHTFKLSDGRTLGYFEFGETRGKPVFYFHGSGAGSGSYAQIVGDTVCKMGIRLIAPDRPGVGGSTFQKDRAILDWPKDIVELSDALKIPRFSILGESGGSAYSYACSLLIPERIDRLIVVSGLCPMTAALEKNSLTLQNRLMFAVLRKSPEWLLKNLFRKLHRELQENSETFFRKAARKALKPEQALLQDPMYQTIFKNSVINAFKQGYEGAIADLRLCSGDWGFDLGMIKNSLHVFHGEKDASAPLGMAEYIQKTVKDCHADYYPGESHKSVLYFHAEEILRKIE